MTTLRELLQLPAAVEALRKRRLERLIADHGIASQTDYIVPRIRMIVSPWFKDENGIPTRTVRAVE